MGLDSFYNKTVVVKRLSSIDDGYGGKTNSWTTQVSSFKCRIKRGSGRLTMTDTGQMLPLTHRLIGPVADIKAGDKIIDGSDEYLVENANTMSTFDSGHHLELELRKI